MAREISKTLPEQILEYLAGEQLVTVVTKCEDGTMVANTISWCVARDASTIRIAADQQSFIISNIQKDPHTLITLYGPNGMYSVTGQAKLINPLIKDIEYPISVIEVNVKQVREIMFYGGKLIQTLSFKKNPIYKIDHLDHLVYQELNK